jgi:hypothetical protein
MAEPDPNVFDVDLREAVDPWGVLHIVRAGEELPAGWRWSDDELERPQAA